VELVVAQVGGEIV